jgi:hypothetical protein
MTKEHSVEVLVGFVLEAAATEGAVVEAAMAEPVAAGVESELA